MQPLTLDPSVFGMTPTQKAEYYNTLLGQGYSDAAIRAAAGQQTDADWAALQGLAAGLRPATQPTGALPTVAPKPDNTAALTGLYQDVFGRAPDEGGFGFWLNAMDNLGYTPEMVRSEFLKSPEYVSKTSGALSQVTTPAPAAEVISSPVVSTAEPVTPFEDVYRDVEVVDQGPVAIGAGLYRTPGGTIIDEAGYPVSEADAQSRLTAPSPAPAPAPAPAAAPAVDTSNPANMVKSIIADPNAVQDLSLSRQQAFDLGEASTYNDPGKTYGNYTVRQLPGSSDFSGVYTPGGYVASTSETAPDNDQLRKLGLAGRPVETTLTYDNEGNLTGTEKRFFRGGDSGIVYRIDPQGNLIDASEFDYSEEWKGAITPLVQMATMALAPYLGTIGGALSGGALSGAAASGLGGAVVGGAGAALTGQDVLKGAALGGLGAAGGQLAQSAGQAASTALGGGALGDIAAGAIRGAAGALPSAIITEDIDKLVAGALSGGVGAGTRIALSELGIPLSGAQIAQGMNFIKSVQNNDIMGAVNAAAQLEGSQNSKVAAAALGVAGALKAGNPQAIIAAMVGLSDALQKPVDPAEAAFNRAKQAGASDAEAAAAARAVTGGDAIDRATAKATGLPVLQMPIPDIEIIDEEWGDLSQAQKDAANRLTLKVGSGEANTPEEAAALAKSKGFGMFEFGGSRYSLKASTADILAQGQPGTSEITGQSGKHADSGFRPGLATGTFNLTRAADILKEKFGNDLSWIDQGDLNAAASFVLANKEDELRRLIDAGQFGKTGQNLGAGERGYIAPRDVTNVDRDYQPPEGFRIAGPAERDTAQVGYDANGIPVYLIQTTTVAGQKMTEFQRDERDFDTYMDVARNQIDPFTGQSYAINPQTGEEYTFDQFQGSKTIRDTIRGVAAPFMKGIGQQIGLAGYLTGSEALSQFGGELEQQGRSITPQIVRQGQENLVNDINAAEGFDKIAAVGRAFVNRPLETLAAVADLTGTEGVQEIVPFGSAFLAKRGFDAALKSRFSEAVTNRASTMAGVAANATVDGLEAGLATAQSVYDTLRGQGFDHERASSMAFEAGVISSAIEAIASKVGEGPVVSSILNRVPGSAGRTLLREGASEAVASAGQTGTEILATSRPGTVLDANLLGTSATLGALAGGPTASVIQVGANLAASQTNAGTGATSTVNSSGSTTSTSGGNVATTSPGGQTTNISVTNSDLTSGNLSNNVATAVNNGADAATVINNVANAATNSGTDVNAATNAAVNAANNAGATVNITGNTVNSTQTNNNVTTNTSVNTDTGVTNSTSVNKTTGATTNTTSDANTSQSTTQSGNTTSTTTTDNNTGSSVNKSVDQSTGVVSQTNTDANTGITTKTDTDTKNNTTTQTTTDANTNTSTTTQTSGNVTTQTTTDANTGNKTQTTTDTTTGVTTQTTTSGNVTTEVTTDTNTNTSTQTQTDTNTGVTTTTQTDTNTGITTQTTTDANVTTTTRTNENTGVTTQVTVDQNTGVTTQITSNPNTGVQTTTTTDTNTETTTTVDTNTNTQTTVVVNVQTGEIIKYEEGEAPKTLTPLPPLTPVGSLTPIDPLKPVSPPAQVTTKPAPTPSAPSGGGGMTIPGAISGAAMAGLSPQFLRSFETQGYIDPLAKVKEAQAEFQSEDLMQQLDPRLAAILQERMGQQQQQEQDSIGALARMLSGEPESANNPYYSYGQEDSIDDILGGRAAGFAKGGYVAPLQMADGGMSLPLLAKEGGHAREDFRDGKHVAGDGDGQSDDIPAWLADGEFVFPADVVSALGNGSTKAGTDKLYEMMHEIRKRARSTDHEDLPPPALKSPLDYLKSKR